MTKIELCTNPSLNLSSIISQDSQNSENSQNDIISLLLGISNQTSLKYKFGDNYIKQEIGFISNFGSSPNPSSIFSNNEYMTDPLRNTVIRPNGNNFTISNITRFTYTCLLESLDNCNKMTKDSCCNNTNIDNLHNLKIEIGINQHIQNNCSGDNNDGWFKYDCRKYLGYGFETFTNAFIWNNISTGVYLELKLSNHINAFAYYNTPQTVASQVNYPFKDKSDGFISNDSLSSITSGIVYKNKICDLNQCLSLAVQRMNEGSINNEEDNNLDWTVPNLVSTSTNNSSLSTTNTQTPVAITTKARESLNSHVKKDSSTTSYTGILSLFTKTAGINMSYTFADYDEPEDNETSEEKARIIKSSIGGYFKARNPFAGQSCRNQYGINIGTPTFLANKEARPTIIELSCFLSFNKINIPLYFDFVINKNLSSSTEENDSNYESAFIVGTKPNIPIAYDINENNIEMKQKNMLDCISPEDEIENIISLEDNNSQENNQESDNESEINPDNITNVLPNINKF